MKTSFIVVGLIVLAALGYYFFMQPAAPAMENTESDSPAMKLDINGVCEGALAYMTFESGAAAEAFVQECIEGKHPEVIEQYKAGLNLDGAMI